MKSNSIKARRRRREAVIYAMSYIPVGILAGLSMAAILLLYCRMAGAF